MISAHNIFVKISPHPVGKDSTVQITGLEYNLAYQYQIDLMIPYWIFLILFVLTCYLWLLSCTPESPVKKNLTRFKAWCKERMDLHRFL